MPPYGDAWRRDTYGFQFPQVFAGGRYNDGIPDVNFSGTGSPASLTGPSASLLSPTTDITAQDTLTWVTDRHTLRSGFLVTRNRTDQNGRFAYTGAVGFNPSGNPNTTGWAFADALLGNFRTYSEGADDPLGFFRFTQYAAFVSDNWRVTRTLSLEAGLRYELSSPTYTQGNNIVNFDPALYDANAAVRLNRNGTLIAGSGNPYRRTGEREKLFLALETHGRGRFVIHWQRPTATSPVLPFSRSPLLLLLLSVKVADEVTQPVAASSG